MPAGSSLSEELGQRCGGVNNPSALDPEYQGDNLCIKLIRNFFIRVRKLLILYNLFEADYVRRKG